MVSFTAIKGQAPTHSRIEMNEMINMPLVSARSTNNRVRPLSFHQARGLGPKKMRKGVHQLTAILPRRVGNEQRFEVMVMVSIKNLHDYELVVTSIVDDPINPGFNIRQRIGEKWGNGLPLNKRFSIHQSVLHFCCGEKFARDIDLVIGKNVHDNMSALGETFKHIAVRSDSGE